MRFGRASGEALMQRVQRGPWWARLVWLVLWAGPWGCERALSRGPGGASVTPGMLGVSGGMLLLVTEETNSSS